jgi:NAD(P)H-quinone oxidoreductase subunit 5
MNDLRVCLQTPWLPALIPSLVILVPDRNTDWYWKVATRLTQLSLIAVILQLVWRVAQPQPLIMGIERTMLILILFLAVIILRFSRIYLRGEEGQSKYVRLLSLTAVSSSLVVVAPRLDVLVLAWMLGSFTMNGLLQHYPDRRAAQLAAHSLYKAHAFLTCGTTVHEYLATRERANVSTSPLTTIISQTLAVVISTLLVGFGYRILLMHTKPKGNDLAAVITVGVGLAPILYRGFTEARSLPRALARYTFLLALYLCWHRLSGLVIGDGSTRSLWLVGSFAALLFTLHLVQSIVQASPASERWASFRHRAFHGFYLDESFTRLIVALWPTRYRHHQPAQSPVAHLEKEYA